MIRITHFLNLYNIFIISALLYVLSVVYGQDRANHIGYVTTNINQSIFRLEGDIVRRLNTNQNHQIQQLFDKYATTDSAMENIVLIDASTGLFYSARRSFQPTEIPANLLDIAQMNVENIDKGVLAYSTSIRYLHHNEPKTAQLIIMLKQEQVKSNLIGWITSRNIELLILISIFLVFSYALLYRLFFFPIVRIMRYVQTNERIAYSFGLKEFTMLYEALIHKDSKIATYEEELVRQLTTDALTGLPNRYKFLEGIQKQDDSGCAILNIDGFSKINDVYGIAVGDGLLLGYARWLERQLASYADTMLFKFSGDEYVVRFGSQYTTEKIRKILETIIAQSSYEDFIVSEIEINITVRAGYAPCATTVIEDATIALKIAKETKTPCVIYDTKAMDKESQLHNIQTYKLIKESVQKSLICAYYQPIVSNKTGKIEKYEALIRIAHQNRVYTPNEFLSTAKQSKFYQHLTMTMLNQVFAMLEQENRVISVNLSIEDILDPKIHQHIEQYLTHANGKHIIFEILESEGIEQYDEVLKFVEHFKAKGVRFAIDDFGSGYSNFHHILKLHVDILKIDSSLIADIATNKESQIIVKNIVNFAKELGIETVAEFVKDKEVYDTVRALGVDMSQGYYFGKPEKEFAVDSKEQ